MTRTKVVVARGATLSIAEGKPLKNAAKCFEKLHFNEVGEVIAFRNPAPKITFNPLSLRSIRQARRLIGREWGTMRLAVSMSAFSRELMRLASDDINTFSIKVDYPEDDYGCHEIHYFRGHVLRAGSRWISIALVSRPVEWQAEVPA